MNESQKHADQKKPDIKEYVLYSFIYMQSYLSLTTVLISDK